MIADPEARMADFRAQFQQVCDEIGKVIVGNREIIEALLTCLLADGHVLLEGIPGLGKTRLVQTLADVLDLKFSRVQFTPDLMPGDIVGTNVLHEDDRGERTLAFQPGPIFANLILADEINRATPKTQSALLEAMQEHTVSVGRISHQLEQPFFVLATQNPLEMEGTYPLPEAQLDRFFMKLKMEYPSADELHGILERTTSSETPVAESILSRDAILDLRSTVRAMPIAHAIQDYAVRITMATHPGTAAGHELANRYFRFGASPRGAQALVIGGKVRALIKNRAHVACEDIRDVVLPALRHRVLLNFEGEAERIEPDDVLNEIVVATPEPGD